MKYNDDGEPQGTAGSPMLKLVLEQGLSNILVVVTRYFGGILLGTGGLVRAYSGAVEKAIESSEIVRKTKGYEAKLMVEYSDVEALRYFLEKNNIKIVNIEYLEKVEFTIEIIVDLVEKLKDDYSHNNFKIEKYEILKEKFVEI